MKARVNSLIALNQAHAKVKRVLKVDRLEDEVCEDLDTVRTAAAALRWASRRQRPGLPAPEVIAAAYRMPKVGSGWRPVLGLGEERMADLLEAYKVRASHCSGWATAHSRSVAGGRW